MGDKYNDGLYSLFTFDKFDEAEEEGYKLYSSDDGHWAVGGLGNDHVCESCATTTPDYAPQEVKDFLTDNGHLDHKHVLLLDGCDEWFKETLS